MRSLMINKQQLQVQVIENQNEPTMPSSDEEFLWLDCQGGDKHTESEYLQQQFSISQLAIDDAQRDRHPPKFEAFNSYNFLLIKAFDAKTDSIDYSILHISFFVSDRYLITIHEDISPSINQVWDELVNNNYSDSFDAYSLLYSILKCITKRYTHVILELETRLDEIESSMVEKPTDDLLAELIRYRTKTQYLNRIYTNQDIVIQEMLNDDPNLHRDELKHKFQDIQEHMERLAGLTALLNDVIKNLVEGYISVSGHKLNQIMKTLTIAAVIFLPLTFIAGIYGMNFEHMPELKIKHAYFFALGTMGFIAAALLILFKKLKWI